MEKLTVLIAVLVSVFVGVAIAFLLPLFLSSERSRAAEVKARERRLAEARTNARLLRLNL